MNQYPRHDPSTPPAATLAYSGVSPATPADQSHLKTLSILHYVWGPLVILFSSIFIIHIVLGAMILKNPSFMAPPAGSGGTAQAPPPGLGWLFIGLGSAAVLLGWTLGILNIISGRAIARRKWRVFSLVISGINCLSIPFGTALGVFTFIVLLRESVIALYSPGISAFSAVSPPHSFGQPPQS